MKIKSRFLGLTGLMFVIASLLMQAIAGDSKPLALGVPSQIFCAQERSQIFSAGFFLFSRPADIDLVQVEKINGKLKEKREALCKSEADAGRWIYAMTDYCKATCDEALEKHLEGRIQCDRMCGEQYSIYHTAAAGAKYGRDVLKASSGCERKLEALRSELDRHKAPTAKEASEVVKAFKSILEVSKTVSEPEAKARTSD